MYVCRNVSVCVCVCDRVCLCVRFGSSSLGQPPQVHSAQPTLGSQTLALRLLRLSANTMIPRLALRLLRLFAQGLVPATTVQDLAAAAWHDGWGRDNEIASRLRRAGNEGRNRQHIHKGVMDAARAAGLLDGMSKPYVVNVPGPKGKSSAVNVYPPHEQLLHAISGANGGLGSFCLTPEQRDHHRGLGPLLWQWAACEDVGLDAQQNIPILGFHADGVVYTTGLRAGGTRSCIVGSINVVSGRTKARRGQRHLFFILGKKRLCN